MKFVDEQGEGTSPTLSALRNAAASRPTHRSTVAPTALHPLIRGNGVTDRRRWETTVRARGARVFPPELSKTNTGAPKVIFRSS